MSKSGITLPTMLHALSLYVRLAWRVFFRPSPSVPRPGFRRLLIMLVFLPLLAAMEFMHWCAFWIDELLFSNYKKTSVRQPIFIVGVPRSGTTYLHRVLALDKEHFTWFTLGELLFAPAICERKIIGAAARLDRLLGRPGARCLEWLTKRLAGNLDAMHAFSLSAPEEDFLLLTPVLACFILVVAFPDDPEIANLAFFDERISPKRRKRIMAFYKSLVQRHLYLQPRDKRLLSKNVSFTPMLHSLLQTFPDARLIACTRDPVKAVPSQISAIEPAWKFFGNTTRDELFRDRWVERMHHYYANLNRTLAGLEYEQAQLICNRELKNHLCATIQHIYKTFGLPVSDNFKNQIVHETRKSRRHTSSHQYSCEAYGLDPEQIRREFASVFNHGRDPRVLRKTKLQQKEATNANPAN